MVELDISRKSGSTLRENLTSVAKQLNKEVEPLLDIVELQNMYDVYLIEEFFKLSSGRGEGMNGPSPLTYQDIKAYCELTGTVYSEWELMTIKQIDQNFISANSSVQHEQTEEGNRV